MARRSRLCICEFRGSLIVSALETLISSAAKVPVVPVLLQTGPKVTSRCLYPLRVEFFLSQWLAPLEGLPYLVRDRAI
jgi:hypothetical protein